VIRVYHDGEQIIEIEPGGMGWMMLP